MFYIFSLLLLLFFAYYHDIKHIEKNRLLHYRLILLYLISVSGFQYMVGVDTYYYVKEFEKLNIDSFQISDLFSSMEERRQPGWMLLMYGCRFFTSNFFWPKMIHAIILNVAVTKFFWKESKVPFLCVFIYALSGFLVLNFNALRQSLAIAFLLYAISAIKRGDIRSFLIDILGAFMFHNTAVVLLGFILFKYIRPNKSTMYIALGSFALFIFALTKLDLQTITYTLIDSGFMGDAMTKQGIGYMQSDWLGVRDEFAIFSLQRLFHTCIILFFIYRTKDMYWGVFGFVFLLLSIISGFMPILWRFRLYIDFGFYLVMAESLSLIYWNQYFRKWGLRRCIFFAALTLSIAFPIKEYLTPYEGSKYRYIDQYYPYNTIFYPEYNKEKMNFFINSFMCTS